MPDVPAVVLVEYSPDHVHASAEKESPKTLKAAKKKAKTAHPATDLDANPAPNKDAASALPEEADGQAQATTEVQPKEDKAKKKRKRDPEQLAHEIVAAAQGADAEVGAATGI